MDGENGATSMREKAKELTIEEFAQLPLFRIAEAPAHAFAKKQRALHSVRASTRVGVELKLTLL